MMCQQLEGSTIPAMSQPRWLNEDEARLWRDYRVLSARINQALEQQLVTDWGMSGADYGVLVHLSEAPDQRLRARDLALALNWERSRLSHQLRRMEQRGLVTKHECPSDARGTIFALTETGFDLIRQAAPSHVEQVRKVFIDVLEPADLAALTAITEKVLSHLDGTCQDVDPCSDDGDNAELDIVTSVGSAG